MEGAMESDRQSSIANFQLDIQGISDHAAIICAEGRVGFLIFVGAGSTTV